MKKYISRIIVIIVLLISCLSISSLFARYQTSYTIQNKVTFSSNLAENVILVESEANRNADGSYSLTVNTDNIGNSYLIMPGVDIPKDPTIKITGKTNVETYLYVKVTNTLPSTVTYSLTSDWEKFTINDEEVYVYVGSVTNGSIPILTNNMLYVSDRYKGNNESYKMTFDVYMIQKISNDPKADYLDNFSN